LAKFLPKEAGLIALPVIIKGTLKEPDVSLPEDTLRFIMKESLPGLIRGMMGGDGDMETDSSFKEIMDIFQGSMKNKSPGKEALKNIDERCAKRASNLWLDLTSIPVPGI